MEQMERADCCGYRMEEMRRADCCVFYDYKRSTSIMFPIINIKYHNPIREGSHQSHTNVYGS